MSKQVYMLMLLERRGYNSRAARVSKKEPVRDGEIANTKRCTRKLVMASWKTVSLLVGPYGTTCAEWSIKEEGIGINVLVLFHLLSLSGQSGSCRVISSLHFWAYNPRPLQEATGKATRCLEIMGGVRLSWLEKLRAPLQLSLCECNGICA